MRNLKFRAWDSLYNKMIHQYVVGKWKLFITVDGDVGGYEDDDNYDNCAVYGDRFIPMQFIGLADKNGKEIYDGDIITTQNDGVLLVNWNEKYASFCLDKEGWLYSHWFGESCNPSECMVIGNIYENPELLEL